MNLDKLEELENKLKDIQNEHNESVVQKIKQKYPGYAGTILSEEFVVKNEDAKIKK